VIRWFSFLLIIFNSSSCRDKSGPSGHLPTVKEVSLVSDSIPIRIDEEISLQEKKLIRLDDEAEWLRRRARVVEAEKKASRLKNIELNLRKRISKYSGWNDRLPPKEGSLSSQTIAEWEVELRARADAFRKAEAAVRLLERDLNEWNQLIIDRHPNILPLSPFVEK